MPKKFILMTAMLFSPLLSVAETCPTPSDLHANQFNGWQALDIDNGTPLSQSRLTQFTHLVSSFALAEWMQDAPEGAGHCYYYGKRPDPSYLNVFLAKNTAGTDKNVSNWQSVSANTEQCHGDILHCRFL